MFMRTKVLLLMVICLIFPLFTACDNSSSTDNSVTDVFNNNSGTRNLIVVISDLHLGADISYAEINVNREPLRAFLEQIRTSRNVKELVIAGDMLDEWFVPASVNTYKGKDQADFVDRIASTNKDVVDKFNQIIKEGKILVTYVPGNHDLAVTKANVERIFPGISQSRDANAQGVGTYSPADCPQIAIEHGHRYNFACAPDPISNQDVAPGSTMPFGYFLTRLATQHVVQGCKQNADVFKILTPNTSGDASQAFLFGYWQAWYKWLTNYPINNMFNEKIIVTNVNGFTDTYSVNDLLPYQTTPNGLIQVKLFIGVQDTWAQRCAANNVAVPISTSDALKFAASSAGTDTMAVIQYFSNPNSNKRIVVFGHTHAAKMKAYQTYNGQKAIYANSGTWLDHNLNGPTTMNFVVITPQNSSATSQTYVGLYNFQNKLITAMAKDSLRF